MENSFDVVLTPENKKSVFQEIMNARTGMPYLIKLSDDDRKSLPKMDDGCKQFVQKSFEFASKNEALDPGSNLLKSGPIDMDLYSFLASVETQLRELLEMVKDTKQVAGSEAYEIARFIYMKAKMNVKLNIPGSQAIADDLGKLFRPNWFFVTFGDAQNLTKTLHKYLIYR